MRPEPPADYRPSFVERTVLRRLFSHSFRIAVRNLGRRPTQACLTVAGLALATGLLVLPNTLKSGITEIIENKWDIVQRQDLNIGLVEPSSARVEHELERPARRDQGRADARRRGPHPLSRHQPPDRVAQPGSRRHAQPGDRHEEHELTPSTDGLIMSAKLADVLGARVGDELVVEALEGRRPIRPVRLTGLAEDFTGIAAYMDRHAINRFLGEGDIITGASFTLDTAHRAEFLRAVKGVPRISWISIKETLRQSFRETTAKMMGMLTTLYLTMAVIVAFE
ncbi:MAG: hypothetical protein WDM96_16340 [Lacunisphaera sp.]